MAIVDAIGSGAIAALDLIKSGTSSDIVAIFDQNYNQVFSNASPMRAYIREVSRVMDHPLENGQIISDYKVILPIEVDVEFIITAGYYLDTYQQIKSVFNSSKLLTVQTKSDNYENMVIAEMPHAERPEFFDALAINIRLRQVKIVQPESDYAPEDETQKDTQASGQQSPAPLPLQTSLTSSTIQAAVY